MIDKVIRPDSPEAATYRTDITGWVSRHGRYYGDDERAARCDGSTVNVCQECNGDADKHWLVCKACRAKQADAKYEALPLVKWDGETLLKMAFGDEYFFSAEEVYEYAENNDIKVEDMQLVVCEPCYPREIDADDFSDSLPEDSEPPVWLQDAIDSFNATLKANRHTPTSWLPGNQRVKMEGIA